MRIYHLLAFVLVQLIVLSSSIPLATAPSDLLVRDTRNINCDNTLYTINGVKINPRSLNTDLNVHPFLNPRTPSPSPAPPGIPPNPLWNPSNPAGHRTIIWCAYPTPRSETWIALTMTSVLSNLPNPNNLPMTTADDAQAIASLLQGAAEFILLTYLNHGEASDYILPNGFVWYLPVTGPNVPNGYRLNIWNTEMQIPFLLVQLVIHLLYDYMHDFGWGTANFVVFEGTQEAGRGIVYKPL